MAKDIPTLTATSREGVGTRVARKLREEKKIPAVVYGHGEGSKSITIDEHEMELILLHGERLLEMQLDGNTQNVLLKDVQYDTFGQLILHADFTRVNLDERIEVSVPVVLVGTPQGTKEGGVLQQNITEITIEIAVRDLPDEIDVRVNDLKLWDKISLGEIELPKGAKLLDDPEEALCSIIEISEEELEEGEEDVDMPAQPEVIGEEESEDDGEETTEE